MAKARIMVVDDSAPIRRMLSETLSADPGLEVVAAAKDGQAALDRLADTPVDALVLDVEMPVLDGLATLRELRKTHPRLPVVMFSTLTERGSAATIDALLLGANDYFPKPAVGSLEASLAVVREQLIPKLKALVAARAAPPPRGGLPPTNAAARPAAFVAIGASTGGPNALAAVFAALPASLAAPIAVVQHMPPMFTKLLADRLAVLSPVRVSEAVEGQPFEPGMALVAPGGFHLEVVRVGVQLRARLTEGPLENSCRPAVDVLFRSAAATFGAGALGVVLTGMGTDGEKGAAAIRLAGGQVAVQDEASSVVWGMPGSVVRAGHAHAVVPLPGIAAEIIRRTARPAEVRR